MLNSDMSSDGIRNLESLRKEGVEWSWK